jgi:hypothetical protein
MGRLVTWAYPFAKNAKGQGTLRFLEAAHWEDWKGAPPALALFGVQTLFA